MNEKNKNLALRVATAVVLLPIVILVFWKGGIATVALVSVAAAIVAGEWFAMAGLKLSHPAAWVGLALAALMPYAAVDLPNRYPLLVATAAFAPIFGLMLLTLVPPDGDLKKAATLGPVAGLAPTYAGLCLGAVAALREAPDGHGFEWIFVVLTATWMNDTGAYISGRLLGKHKLYPAVSPNKTWEGFWGGMVIATGALCLGKLFVFPELRWLDCVLIGIITGALGPIGDLAESMMKRAYGVKDSGKTLPGHGGFYDRVDALMFNAPFVWLYALYLKDRL